MASSSSVERRQHPILDPAIKIMDDSERDKAANGDTLKSLKLMCSRIFNYYDSRPYLDADILLRLQQLKLRVLALEYRIPTAFGGSAPSAAPLPGNEKMMERLAELWLANQPLKSYEQVDGHLIPVTTLSEHQKRALTEGARYRLFATLILEHEELRNDYFKWVLIDNCPVAPYIEFPGACQKIIRKAFLHKRIGYFSEGTLQIDLRIKGNRIFKRLTLPFETEEGTPKRRSLLTLRKSITFPGGLRVMKGYVFHQFSKKNVSPGNFEMIGGTIHNWNYFYGRQQADLRGYSDFELSTPDWYRQLPVFDRFTEMQMRNRYHLSAPLHPTQWVLVVRANRDTPTMDIAGTHGFLEFLVPDGSGHYNMYPFTFIATEFVTGYPAGSRCDLIQKIRRLGRTERGLWAYPDETVFYTRQQAAFPIVIEHEMGVAHMEALREDFLNARAGYEHFQISYKNCAGTVQMQSQRVHSTAVVPHLFTADIMESTPREPLGRVFRWIREKPNFVFVLIIWTVGILLTSFIGMVVRTNRRYRYACMMGNPVFTRREIFHAGKIFQHILDEPNRGAIWYGHRPK